MIVGAGYRAAIGFGPLIALLLTFLAQSAAAGSFDHAGLAQRVLETEIVPAQQEFLANTGVLRSQVGDVCSGRTKLADAKLRDAFARTVDSWGRVEVYRFGPIELEDRRYRVLFWPDPRNVSRRVLRKLLSQEEELADWDVRNASVAAIGLRVLDALLFSPARQEDLSDGKSATCKIVGAVSQDLELIAREMLQGWNSGGSYRPVWLTPGPENSSFVSPSETSFALIKSYEMSLQALLQQRLPPENGGKTKWRVLPSSRTSMVLVQANLEALDGLLDQVGQGPLFAPDKRALSVLKMARTELGFAIRAIRGTQNRTVQEIEERAGAMRRPIESALKLGVQAISVLSQQSPPSFNALDGD